MFWTFALNAVSARMKHGEILVQLFLIWVFLYLVSFGIVLLATILTMIGTALDLLGIKILTMAAMGFLKITLKNS